MDKQTKENKMITLKIESSTEGHICAEMPVCDAIGRIQTEVNQHGKWLYVDGSFVSNDTINDKDIEAFQDTLANGSDITLVSALLGG